MASLTRNSYIVWVWPGPVIYHFNCVMEYICRVTLTFLDHKGQCIATLDVWKFVECLVYPWSVCILMPQCSSPAWGIFLEIITQYIAGSSYPWGSYTCILMPHPLWMDHYWKLYYIQDEDTALLIAIGNGNKEIVEELLVSGADPNMVRVAALVRLCKVNDLFLVHTPRTYPPPCVYFWYSDYQLNDIIVRLEWACTCTHALCGKSVCIKADITFLGILSHRFKKTTTLTLFCMLLIWDDKKMINYGCVLVS